MCRRGAAASSHAAMRMMASSGCQNAARTGACGVFIWLGKVLARPGDAEGRLRHGGSKGEALVDHLHGGWQKCHGMVVSRHDGKVQVVRGVQHEGLRDARVV